MRRKRSSYKFTEKKHSKMAMIAFGLAVVTLLIYFVFVYLSYRSAGQLSAYYGAFGFLAMLVAIVSMILSIAALKEEDSFMFFPYMAMAASVISSLMWVGNYIQGFVRG